MQVDFYHLTRSPVERALPQIVGRILAQGGRLLVVSADAEVRSKVDQALWSHTAESFLPHGQAGGPDDVRQPVLIGEGTGAANGARFVALVDGVWRDEALGFERAFHFFDEDRIAEARAAWRGLSAREDVTRNYWKQKDNGGWEKVA
jgi:DNA polymerase III subunit chi